MGLFPGSTALEGEILVTQSRRLSGESQLLKLKCKIKKEIP